MTKTDIYIGLNDQDTKEQKFATEKYVSILQNVCVSYRVAFSFNLIGAAISMNPASIRRKTRWC